MKYTQLLVSFNPTTFNIYMYIELLTKTHKGFMKRLDFVKFYPLKANVSLSWSHIQFKISFYTSGISMKYCGQDK